MIVDTTLNESLATAKLHLKRAKYYFNQLKKIKINSELFEDEEKIKTIDAFILRFIKLQDFMGRKLFKTLLEATGDYQDSMSMIDVLDKLEKMKLIPDSDKWNDYKKNKNDLTDEYPESENNLLSGINIALQQLPEIEKILLDVENYVVEKKL
jgi:hypothetical protein